MKKVILFFNLVVLIALCVGFSSCNNSNNNEKSQKEDVNIREKGVANQSQLNPTSPASTSKNNLIKIRLEAIVNSKAARNGVSNIKCNYGDGDYRLLGGYNFNDSKGRYLEQMFSSGYITVPRGKSWIYKDAKIINEAPNSYTSNAVIAKKNDVFIRLNDTGVSGITLHEGNVFKVYCSAINYGNRARKVPDGSVVGVEFTFIEIGY